MTRILYTKFLKTIRYSMALGYLLSARAALAQYGLEETRGKAGLKTGDLPSLAGQIIQALLGLVGIIFFGLTVYGGFIWMKARGNEQEVEKAKNVLTQAITGLVLIAAAYAITVFVLGALK